MTTMTIGKTFSPNGLRGSAPERHHEPAQRGGASQSEVDIDHSHDHYDDGLVHGHSWHSTSNVR